MLEIISKSKGKGNESVIYQILLPTTVSLTGFLEKFEIKHDEIKLSSEMYPIRNLGRKQEYIRFTVDKDNCYEIETLFDRYWEDYLDANGFV